jgi:hypothetical protein
MNLLYRIVSSLPDSTDVVSVEVALESLRELFTPYEVVLHGSWLLDLAFQDSDVDVAIIAHDNTFKHILQILEERTKKRKFSGFRIRGRVVTNADMKVIPLSYDNRDGDTRLDIDLTLQSRARLEHVFRLHEWLERYGFHDLYRSVKIILRDNHLYGHKLGGLNSFSIGWMIVAMIEYYRINTNLLTLHPDWFRGRDDDAHTYTLLLMFCEFYIRTHNEGQLLRMCDDNTLEVGRVRLSFDNWRDIHQPWLPRVYLCDKWITNKTWRYNYILRLFAAVCRESDMDIAPIL